MKKRNRVSLDDKFNRKISKISETGCWLWMGNRHRQGYGIITLFNQATKKEKAIMAHRVAWELFRGPIPKGLNILHRCDNCSCVNPHHLFLGTQNDNVQDMMQKRRNRQPKGERNGYAKLKDADVRNILQDTDSIMQIARKYRVGHECIRRIKRGESWQFITVAEEGKK